MTTAALTPEQQEALDRAQRIRDRIAGAMPELFGQPVRFRYFQKGNGPCFCWTVERVDGKFESYVYKPVGKGVRSGTAQEWDLDPKTIVKHRLRKDAKARALRLFKKEQK